METYPHIKKQQGLVLLTLVIGVFLMISGYYFSSISVVEIKAKKVEKTQEVLKRAKRSLLDYALVNWRLTGQAGKIGKLPCPDYNSAGVDGEQDGNCGSAYANAIGYFPWRTLGIDNTKDSSGNCLLYAVSPAYKTSPVAALNPDSFGQFRIVDNTATIVQGALPEDRPIAVIISPGTTVNGQVRGINPSRACGSYYNNDINDFVSAYLDNNGVTNNAAIDSGVINVIDTFVSKYTGSEDGNNPLNDRVVTITYREFWDVMQDTITSVSFNDRMKNLTEAISLCFSAYGVSNPNNNLPMPAPLDLSLGEYRRNVDYDDSGVFTSAFAGRLPFNVDRANAEISSGNMSNIFDNTFCDGLELATTAGSDGINFTNDSGGDQGEYFDLWQNWKDHFFYVVSSKFKPGGAGVSCSGDCLTYDGVEYAGLIIFSGLKQAIQSRYALPFESDEKLNISNYLEEGRAAIFPDDSGDGIYPVVTPTSNDVIFCIKTDMSIAEC